MLNVQTVVWLLLNGQVTIWEYFFVQDVLLFTGEILKIFSIKYLNICRSMGAHISKIKHLKLDQWEDAQVTRMKEVGNLNSKLKYEQWVPPSYRRVGKV